MDPRNARFTKEALEAQDGKKVPLTLEIGGPVIGKATMHYDPETGNLSAQFQVNDPKIAEFLEGESPSVIFRKES